MSQKGKAEAHRTSGYEFIRRITWPGTGQSAAAPLGTLAGTAEADRPTRPKEQRAQRRPSTNHAGIRGCPGSTR